MSEYVGILIFLSGILLGVYIICKGIIGLLENNPIYIPKRVDLAIGSYFYFLYIFYVYLRTRAGIGSEERILCYSLGLITISVIIFTMINKREILQKSFHVYGIGQDLFALVKSALSANRISFSESNQKIHLSENLGSITISINSTSGIAQISFDINKNPYIFDRVIRTMKELNMQQKINRVEPLPIIIYIMMGLALVISSSGLYFLFT